MKEKIWLSSPHLTGEEQKYVKEAFDNTVSTMKDTMGEYTIPAIAESPIVDVFPYFTGEEEDMERLKSFVAIKDSVPTRNDMNDQLEQEDVLAHAMEEE